MGHFDAGLFFWSLATFAGLMLLLTRFAFKPLRELLAQREKHIRDAVDEAKQARDAARQLVEQHQAELNQAKEEARHIVTEGNRMAAERQEEAKAQAKEHANLLVEQARSEIERETRKSLDDLKSTLASLSVRIARQVIREGIDEERHNELADQFIERLKKTRRAGENKR